jgi:TRAP-type C4-dicarboxylate transport system substrate-binding protein
MLAALEPHGLVGLGLVYEGLRHPVAYSGAIDEVGDFDGLPIRVPASRASVALFEALGARPVHSSATPTTTRAARSTPRRAASPGLGRDLTAAP